MADAFFRLTYATMFDPPANLHDLFEQALAYWRANLEQEYPLTTGDRPVFCEHKLADHSPAGLSTGPVSAGRRRRGPPGGGGGQAGLPPWSLVPWPERVATLRRVA